MHDAERVLEARVHCSGVDIVRKGELADASQPLKRRLGDDFPLPVRERNKPVNRTSKLECFLFQGIRHFVYFGGEFKLTTLIYTICSPSFPPNRVHLSLFDSQAGEESPTASARICRCHVRSGMRQNLLRGGIPMNANYMEKGNALRLSPRSGFNCAKNRAMNFDKIPNNSINIDKLTGFFDKNSAREIIVKHCNSMVINTNLSAGDSNMAAKFFRRTAFARIRDEMSGLARISAQLPARTSRVDSRRQAPHAPPRICVDRLSSECVRIFSGKNKHGWTRAIREMETGGLPLSEEGGLSLAGNPSPVMLVVFSA